jgi:hypothetical protein
MWKWKIQQKINLFLWLVVNNKILTWNNLQLRGWKGPGRCQLCKKDCEDSAHLFILCPFTKLIWLKIKNIKKFTQVWRGIHLNECLSNWTTNKNASPSLATYIFGTHG